MLKYYVIIGFSRYTHKSEISKSTYDHRIDKNTYTRIIKNALPPANDFTIETLNGSIGIQREKVNFIEFTKEETE